MVKEGSFLLKITKVYNNYRHGMTIDCYILDKQINFHFRNVRNKMNVSANVWLIYDIINDNIVLLKQHGLFSDSSTGIFADVACIPSYKTTGYTIILKTY